MRRRALLRLKVLLPVGLLIGGGAAAWGQCPMEWKSGFGVPGMDDTVFALALFDDDGDGPRPPALYAGGEFYTAGDAFAQSIARWDGTNWSTLPGRISGRVYALCVYDDGTGPALFVGGDFSFYDDTRIWNIAKWDGANWSYIGSVPGHVDSLAVFDDGGGPALYVGGYFTQAGGVPAKHIAKWDGATWSALGSGMYSYDFSPEVRALCVYDDGTGAGLYAGGHFSKAGDVPAGNIARWNGSSWSAVGGGIGGNRVYALAVFDDGSGPGLFVGGDFGYAGPIEANNIAKWDGTSWSALGAGTDWGDTWPHVYALCAFDDGSGPALYVGGGFWYADGVLVYYIARWDGAEFSALSTGMWGWSLNDEGVFALLGEGQGPGSSLYVGGAFSIAGDVAAAKIARWDGTAFAPLGSGNGLSDAALALAVFDEDGDGPSPPALFAGGAFLTAGPLVTDGIARWDGAAWSRLGPGIHGTVYALTVFDDGSGPALYAGGYIVLDPEGPWTSVAKWDGNGWTALGGGMDNVVTALGGFDDDGPGPHPPALYAGGYFTQAGGLPANHIAKWDGSTWSPLGDGLSGEWDANVSALCEFGDGSGPALYVGGNFTQAGGVTAWGIARWNSVTWSAVGGGVHDGPYAGSVSALTLFDDGSGEALYVGGGFPYAGDVQVNHVARWNGTAWSPLAGGTDGGVLALAPFNDGAGPGLYAGGYFDGAGAVEAHGVARWDGVCWSALGSGSAGVGALAGLWESERPSLYVGMSWLMAGEHISVRFGRWSCVTAVLGDLNCDAVIDEYDIDPFVVALVAPDVYGQTFPNCDIGAADCNGDGTVDAFDIDPFVALLIGP